ncbi:MAG: ABC transporter permease subunit [Azospirillum sp.]|nr:ABC transporter permease subunit [Azospirillum sp.]
MTKLLTLAVQEVRTGLRNRWVVATTLLMTALALTLAFLGSAPTGTVGVGGLTVTVVSLSSLTIFLLPLIALLLAYDAVVGEVERGTLILLLSYPVGRGQVVFGKFLGQTAILAFATALGYGAAGLALAAAGTEASPAAWHAFAAMIGSSVVLGAAFTAIGLLISVAARDRGTAAGLAVGAWLGLVLLYDMGLLGALVADQGRFLSAGVVNLLLLANPTDSYRLLNLSGFAEVGRYAGMAGLAAEVHLGPAVLAAALGAWVALPLAAAAFLFHRRQF